MELQKAGFIAKVQCAEVREGGRGGREGGREGEEGGEREGGREGGRGNSSVCR